MLSHRLLVFLPGMPAISLFAFTPSIHNLRALGGSRISYVLGLDQHGVLQYFNRISARFQRHTTLPTRSKSMEIRDRKLPVAA